MKRKQVCAAILSAALVFSMAGCGGGGGSDSGEATADKPIVLKIGSTVQDTSAAGRVMNEVFKPKLEELSGGKIKVEVYNNGVLGGDRQVTEALQIGTVQAGGVPLSVLSNFDSKFIASELPFAFQNKEEAYAALDGDFGAMMAENLEQQGMVLVGYMENSFRNISNNNKPIEKWEDLKGLKIRVMESPMYLSMFKKLGANPTPMTFNDLYTGLQQGTVDGQDNGTILTYTAKFYEVQKYYSMVGQNYAAGAIVISKKFWDSLTPELQEAVREASELTKDTQREWNTKEEEEALKAMEDAGTKVNVMSDAEKERMKEVLVPVVWDEFRDDIGEPLYEELLHMTEKYGARDEQ